MALQRFDTGCGYIAEEYGRNNKWRLIETGPYGGGVVYENLPTMEFAFRTAAQLEEGKSSEEILIGAPPSKEQLLALDEKIGE